MANRLYRSRTERKIAGVCGGIAEYFDLDPSLVRVLFVVLLFFNGFGLLAYLIGWIVFPEAPVESSTIPASEQLADAERQILQARRSRAPSRWATVIGLFLIAGGVAILIERLIAGFDIGDVIPYLLIVAGLMLFYRGWSESRRQRLDSPSHATSHATE